MIDYPILLVKSLIQECLASPIQRFLGDSLMFAQTIDASELFYEKFVHCHRISDIWCYRRRKLSTISSSQAPLGSSTIGPI